MRRFTANKLKEVRVERGYSQREAAKYMHISDRTLRAIEANERQVTTDEIIQFSRIYRVDVRELLLEEYVNQSEEQILFNRYISLYRLFDQLGDKDKEDVAWVLKQRIAGLI
ncbi:Helix-turn-helix [Lachnospiraceae bacterium C10]|nr:Helix-turn-helix [Lachnospiraceae bacterium C10]SDX08088.1 Helix-turn-helix [Lachnospiraceae bacterium KHCPX20]